jgi:hypothetical protein
MIHPALRQIDVTQSFVGDAVEDTQRGGPVSITHPYPESPLLSEWEIMTSGNPTQARILTMYSPFDKAGLAFMVSQRDNPRSEDLDQDLQTPMLGRIGLLGAGPVDGRIPYQIGQEQPMIAGKFISDGSLEMTDFWHVDLWGWALPNVPYKSRNLFERNMNGLPNEEGAHSSAGFSTAKGGWFSDTVTETPSWHQIYIRPNAVIKAWEYPRQLIKDGHVPVTLP